MKKKQCSSISNKKLEQQKQATKEKINIMIAYIMNINECRSKLLLSYFVVISSKLSILTGVIISVAFLSEKNPPPKDPSIEVICVTQGTVINLINVVFKPAKYSFSCGNADIDDIDNKII